MSATSFQRARREALAKEAEAAKLVEAEGGLTSMKVPELKEIAKEKGILGYSNMKREELIKALEGAE